MGEVPEDMQGTEGPLIFTGSYPPPPPLHKHPESQKNDGQTGSRCLDKAVLARDVRYQPSQE